LEQLVQFLGSSSVVAYFIIKKAHTAEAVNAVHNEFFGYK
jgi:aspartokinase